MCSIFGWFCHGFSSVAVNANHAAFSVCLIQARIIVFDARLIILARYQHVHMLYAVMTLYVHFNMQYAAIKNASCAPGYRYVARDK